MVVGNAAFASIPAALETPETFVGKGSASKVEASKTACGKMFHGLPEEEVVGTQAELVATGGPEFVEDAAAVPQKDRPGDGSLLMIDEGNATLPLGDEFLVEGAKEVETLRRQAVMAPGFAVKTMIVLHRRGLLAKFNLHARVRSLADGAANGRMEGIEQVLLICVELGAVAVKFTACLGGTRQGLTPSGLQGAPSLLMPKTQGFVQERVPRLRAEAQESAFIGEGQADGFSAAKESTNLEEREERDTATFMQGTQVAGLESITVAQHTGPGGTMEHAGLRIATQVLVPRAVAGRIADLKAEGSLGHAVLRSGGRQGRGDLGDPGVVKFWIHR